MNLRYISMCSLDHDISEGKQSNNKIMQFIVVDKEAFKILSINFIRSIPYFHYLFQL